MTLPAGTGTLREVDSRANNRPLEEQIMGEPASVTIEKQAVNVVTCSDYNEYMMKTGWVDSSGKGHPGWAGGTEYLAINYSVKYEERIKRAQARWRSPRTTSAQTSPHP